MAFSLSYTLSRARQVEEESKSDPPNKSLKRPCPFPEDKEKGLGAEVLPEAIEVLDSIFASLCPFSGDSIENEGIQTNANGETGVGAQNEDTRGAETVDRIVESNDASLAISPLKNGAAENEQMDPVNNYSFSYIPYQITGSWKEFESKKRNNYLRGCKWAPDGSCILTCSEDNYLRIFNLPEEIFDFGKWLDMPEMEVAVKISEGELIYDYCWYPLMNSSNAISCCLASCSKNSPVHLWDGFTGELRCSYRSYDQVDEITHAHSISFDTHGQRIFCGFDKTIRVFDVNTPGRDCEERHTFAKKSGQAGIISCFAFHPTNEKMSAVGSYRKSIGIYSEPDGHLQCVLEGQQGGVTQLQFSPDGNLLYSGGRMDPEILCWDVRYLGNVLFSLRRCCKTNQRMYFDISRCGQYVVSGNHNGVISVWDTYKEPIETAASDFCILEPIQYYMAHEDCVNGVSLHPSYPILCSVSGQRQFPELLTEDHDQMFASDLKQCDNSLRLWWVGTREGE